MVKSFYILFINLLLIVKYTLYSQNEEQLIQEILSGCNIQWTTLINHPYENTSEYILTGNDSERRETLLFRRLINDTSPMTSKKLGVYIKNIYYPSTKIFNQVEGASILENGFVFNAYMYRDNPDNLNKDVHTIVDICGVQYLLSYFSYFSLNSKNYEKLACLDLTCKNIKCKIKT